MAESVGPAEASVEPVASARSVEGPAFSFGVKLLAGVLMLALCIYALRSFGRMLQQPDSLMALALMVFAVVCLAIYYGWMLRSRTRVDPTHIQQTWFRSKRVALVDITQLKLIFVPGLAWLISPRLVVRTREPGSIIFHAADAKVIEAFVRLAMRQVPLP